MRFDLPIVLGVVFFSAIAYGRPLPNQTEPIKPNVLWIVSDDLSPDLGCYGCNAVKTPNLDRFAKSSIRYNNAFATSPVCSPSRSAFVTGLFQTSIGAHHHRTRNRKKLPEGSVTVMEAFRNAGYFVCNQGKTDYNFKTEFKFDGKDWKGRKEGQPFFAQIQIKEPHRSFHKNQAPDRLEKIKIPPRYPDHPLVRADWANYLHSVEVMDQKVGKILKRLDQEGLTDSTVVVFFGDHGRPHVWGKQWLYDAGIQVPLLIRIPGRQPKVDKQLVSLIDIAPTSLKIANIPVPMSMQGRTLTSQIDSPRKYVFAARDRCGDAVDRVRCVRSSRFKYIRNYHPEQPYSKNSSYKDLQYPVLTLLRVLNANGKLDAVQAQMMADRKPEQELYDLESDPEEINNLVDSPDYKVILAELSAALDRWESETGDQGKVAEMSHAEVDKLKLEKRRWFQGQMKKRGLGSDCTDEEYLRWWESKLKPTVKPGR